MDKWKVIFQFLKEYPRHQKGMEDLRRQRLNGIANAATLNNMLSMPLWIDNRRQTARLFAEAYADFLDGIGLI